MKYNGVPTKISATDLRKAILSELHGIPKKDIFVDPNNGVELYRTPRNTWVHNPKNREED